MTPTLTEDMIRARLRKVLAEGVRKAHITKRTNLTANQLNLFLRGKTLTFLNAMRLAAALGLRVTLDETCTVDTPTHPTTSEET